MRSPMAHFVCRMILAVSAFTAFDVAKLRWQNHVTIGEIGEIKKPIKTQCFNRLNLNSIGAIGAQLGILLYFIVFPFKMSLNLSSNSTVAPLVVGFVIFFLSLFKFLAHLAIHSSG